MNKGYYITSKGERVELESKDSLGLNDRDIVELVVPLGVKLVYCWDNKLKELNLPEGIKDVYCSDNELKELELPKGVKWVVCDPIKINRNGNDECEVRISM